MGSQAGPFANNARVPILSGPRVSVQYERMIDMPLAEFVSAVVTILFFSGISLTILGVKKGYHLDVTNHDWVTAAAQWLVYCISLPYMFRCRDSLFQCAQKQKLIWMLVLFAILSACWSGMPLLTVKSAILLSYTTVWGMYFGRRYHLAEQFRILACAFGLAIALSYFLALAVPEYGIMTWEHVGAWEGIYPHRNTLARAMVLAVLVFVFRARTKERFRFSCWLAIAVATLLILFSQSRTGLIILLLFFVLMLLSPALRWTKWRFVLSCTVMGAFAISIVRWLPWMKILDLLGRDETLTGRLPLWILVTVKALKHPWLGYGYEAFWPANGGESIRIWKVMQWTAPNAHNGLLDLWVSLGLIGLVLFLAGYATIFWKAFKIVRSSYNVESLWPFVYLVFLLLYNIDETNVLQQNSLTWALYVAVAASMISGLNNERRPISPRSTLSEEKGFNG